MKNKKPTVYSTSSRAVKHHPEMGDSKKTFFFFLLMHDHLKFWNTSLGYTVNIASTYLAIFFIFIIIIIIIISSSSGSTKD